MKRIHLTMSAAIAAAIVVAFAGRSFAALYEFSSKNASGDFALENVSWNGQTGFPSNGDRVQIASYAQNKGLYLTADHSVALQNLYFKTGNTIATQGNGNVLRFDAMGHEFTLPSYAGGYGSTTPILWQVFVPSGQQLSSADYSLILLERSESTSTAAVAKFSDIAFRQETDADFSTRIHFTRGTYNFFDPEGVMSGTAYKLRLGYTTIIPTEIRFSGGTKVRARQIEIVSAMSILVDNAELYSHYNMSLPGGLLVLTNNAALSLGDLASFQQSSGSVVTNYLGSISVSNYSMNASARFVQKDGSLALKGVLTMSGGEVDIDGGSAVVNGEMPFSAATSVLRVSGGSLTVKGANGFKITTGGPLIEISGGTVTIPRTRWGEGTSTTAATIRQTGGVLATDVNAYQSGIWLNWNGNMPCTIELLGGETRTKAVYARKSIRNGGSKTATFVGDGGTVKALTTTPFNIDSYPNVPLIGGMDSATLGDGGLVVDTGSYASKIVQDFSDVGGEDGWLMKVGSSTLEYSGTYAASKAVVALGTLKLIDATPSFETELVITNGATFSIVGTPSAVTLDALVLTNGVLALDPGDVLTVNGPVSMRKLALNWSSVPSAATPFLVVSGEIDDATKAAIRAAMFSNALSDGTHASYTFSYDAGTGKTTVSANVVADTPLSDSVTWTGSGAWATPGNWSGSAVPTATQIASFSSSSAGKTVTVAAGDKAGALAFGTDGYTLTGTGPLEIVGEIGAASIAATAGANTIDVPILLSAQTTVPVEAGASLAITKPMSYGGIAKTGTGKLTLGADNSTENGISSSDGILEVAAEGALGSSAMDNVPLRGGTVQFAEANGVAMHIPANISVSTPASSNLVVFKVDTDTMLDVLGVAQGAFCKRGVGKLTVNIPGGTTYKLSNGAGNVSGGAFDWYKNGLVFPSDGTAPDTATGLYPGFSVAEGEMALVGTGAGAKASITGANAIIGLYAKTCASQPMLTVDNVDCDFSSGDWFLGHSVGMEGVGVTNPVLRILNGGRVTISNSQIGYNGTHAQSFVTMAATNGTLRALGSGFYLTRMWGGSGAKAYYRFKDSNLYSEYAVTIGGGIDLDFDNSVFSTSSGGLVALSAENDRPWGTLAFRNGSMFAYGGFTENSIYRDLTFAFDDAELLLHKNRASATLAASGSGHVHYEMRGAGAVLKPASGATYTINAKLEGTGGLVVDGAGTVAFGANSAQFTGVLDVRQGIADFSSNGGAASFTAAKGAGTVSGATMGDVTLPVTLLPDGTVSNVLTFANCTCSGRVTVDLGRTAENPLEMPYPQNLLVARYTGTAPDVVRWRMTGSGVPELRGKCVAENGEIRMRVYRAGFMVNFR